MPRTRLVWHLFIAWCSLVAVVLVASSWLASVQLARIAEEDQRQRLTELARLAGAVTAPHDESLDPETFADVAGSTRTESGVTLELLAIDGRPLIGEQPPEAAAATARMSPGDERLMAEARAGRVAAASRFEPATGRRSITVAVPHGPPAAPTAIIRASVDTRVADRELAAAQRRLLAAHLALAAAATAVGYVLAHRAVRPVHELSLAAKRLAAGEIEAPLPATDLAEVADLAAAIAGLREQLVERGLLIGRQGTQQEAVLGSMIEGVLAIDGRQRIVGINRAAAELLGLDLDHVVRRSLQEVVRNPDLRRFALRAIDCREPVEDDLVLHGARDRTIRLRGTALRDVSGEGGAVIVLNDVTDVQRLENVRRDFVANVSHELKTPLTSISGYTETLLTDTPDAATSREFLAIILSNAHRMQRLVDDLLDLARIESGRWQPRVDTVDVAAAARDVWATLAERATMRATRFEVRVEPEVATLEADPDAVRQVLTNLIDNSLRYVGTGGQVTFVARTLDGGVELSVADNGAGIPSEHLPRIFERFYRADPSRSREEGGTGLGLSIVKHLVEAHGGRVSAESTLGVGTTIRCWFPRGTATA